jgi:hypothetical protein
MSWAIKRQRAPAYRAFETVETAFRQVVKEPSRFGLVSARMEAPLPVRWASKGTLGGGFRQKHGHGLAIRHAVRVKVSALHVPTKTNPHAVTWRPSARR